MTTHYMKLNAAPFQKIACGQKTIELRLNDEKRRAVKIGDVIVFSNCTKPNETICTKVIQLHHFADFNALYKALPLDKCGYLPEELHTAAPQDMETCYSVERQKQYGVLGIEIALIQT